ncbi:hypothetical protein JYU19_02730, partial [bacterium AH-315-J21]|nr:hypothetical protein [bacterium AH-315-J21]
PLNVVLGLSHYWSESFLTSIDFDYRGFSSSDFLLLDSIRISQGGTKETFFHNEPTNWNNVLQIRVGGEYTIESKLGQIPLRAGFGYLPQPFSDVDNYFFTYNGRRDPRLPLSIQRPANEEAKYNGAATAFLDNADVNRFNDALGSQVSAISFSFGFGLHSEQRTLDIAYSFTSYSQSFNTTVARELGTVTSLTPNEFDPSLTSDAAPYLVNGTRNSISSVRDHRITISFTGYF